MIEGLSPEAKMSIGDYAYMLKINGLLIYQVCAIVCNKISQCGN
jgi:hypothetical protein